MAGQFPISAAPRFYSWTGRRPSHDELNPRQSERDTDEVDVCIVGGGPAGLAAAIRLKQLANASGNDEFRVMLLEKASELGDHILSGNVMEPVALNRLLPDWNDEANPPARTRCAS
jgi:electron-transferring-flavoprotein dehydrogenase